MSELKAECLRELYWEQGLSKTEIAQQFGVSRKVIDRRFQAWGIPVRNVSEASKLCVQRGRNRGIYHWKLENVPVDELRKLYWENKLSCREIAEKYGVNCATVVNYFDHVGILKRSRSERQKLTYDLGKHDMSNYCRGERNYRWKGGKQSCKGYVRVLLSQHHRADTKGYVLEHILVWEQSNHKTLPDGWVVHHLNGIKDDNRPDNLLAMPTSKHDNFIPALKARIRELESQLNEAT